MMNYSQNTPTNNSETSPGSPEHRLSENGRQNADISSLADMSGPRVPDEVAQTKSGWSVSKVLSKTVMVGLMGWGAIDLSTSIAQRLTPKPISLVNDVENAPSNDTTLSSALRDNRDLSLRLALIKSLYNLRDYIAYPENAGLVGMDVLQIDISSSKAITKTVAELHNAMKRLDERRDCLVRPLRDATARLERELAEPQGNPALALEKFARAVPSWSDLDFAVSNGRRFDADEFNRSQPPLTSEKDLDRRQILKSMVEIIESTSQFRDPQHFPPPRNLSKDPRVTQEEGNKPSTTPSEGPAIKPEPPRAEPPRFTRDDLEYGPILSSVGHVLARDLRDYLRESLRLEQSSAALLKEKGLSPSKIKLDSVENLAATFDALASSMKAIKESLPKSDLTVRPAVDSYQLTFTHLRDAWRKGELEGLRKLHALFTE